MPDRFGTPEMFGDIVPLPEVPDMDNGVIKYRRWKSTTHTHCQDCVHEVAYEGSGRSIRPASYVRSEGKTDTYLCLEHVADRRTRGV